MNDTSLQATLTAAAAPGDAPVVRSDKPSDAKVHADKVSVFYGAKQALFEV